MQDVKVNKNGKLYKFFRVMYKIRGLFLSKRYLYEATNPQVDLCSFVRITFIWPAFLFTAYLLTYVSAITAVSLPFILFGFISVFWATVIIAAVIGLGVGIPFGLWYLFEEVDVVYKVKHSEPVAIAKSYYKALKSKICPFVKFVEEDK